MMLLCSVSVPWWMSEGHVLPILDTAKHDVECVPLVRNGQRWERITDDYLAAGMGSKHR